MVCRYSRARRPSCRRRGGRGARFGFPEQPVDREPSDAGAAAVDGGQAGLDQPGEHVVVSGDADVAGHGQLVPAETFDEPGGEDVVEGDDCGRAVVGDGFGGRDAVFLPGRGGTELDEGGTARARTLSAHDPVGPGR
ncbi:hypothetical protein GCM10022222_29140 [Amycolatopsis ultiminotia]|uniref:Uncharacterized protein n=1 Tax=Amycolatopsis ultiminotia TaxID=543629 RepID=A0ABP6W2H1_9PSEU